MWTTSFLPTIFLSLSICASAQYVRGLSVDNATSVARLAEDFANMVVSKHYVEWTPNRTSGIFWSLPEELGGSEIAYGESASIWDTLVTYAHLTGDSQYNDVIFEAMYTQMGDDVEGSYFMPSGNQYNRSQIEYQSQWALAALSAAEFNFSSPDNRPTYLDLAEGVFWEQVVRWMEAPCGGGLRGALSPSETGYNRSSAFAASNFFQLAARLYKLTENEEYAFWANTSLSWAQGVGLVDLEAGMVYNYLSIKDGNESEEDEDVEECNVIKTDSITSTNSVLGNWIQGAATMYNATNAQNTTWTTPLTSLLSFIPLPPFTSADPLTNNTIIDPICLPPSAYNTSFPSLQTSYPTTSHTCGMSQTHRYAHSLSRTLTLIPSLVSNSSSSSSSTSSSGITSLLRNSANSTRCAEAETSLMDSNEDYSFEFLCPPSWGLDSLQWGWGVEDSSVVTAAAAMEVWQGLLWGLDRRELGDDGGDEDGEEGGSDQGGDGGGSGDDDENDDENSAVDGKGNSRFGVIIAVAVGVTVSFWVG